MVRQSRTIRPSSDATLWCQIALLINPLCTSIFFQQNMKQRVPCTNHDCRIISQWFPGGVTLPWKLSNWQIRSDPGPSAVPSELLLLLLSCCCYDSPCLHALITPDVRSTGHKKLPTPAAWTRARPGSLSPDPSHFIHFHCLSNWVWPAASQPEPPLTFTFLLSLVCLSTVPQKQQRAYSMCVSVLCAPTIHRMAFVS